eukprot:Skav220228  [mRNA]  locus=scaffold749:227287:228582:- [translate_table: standard]
MLDPRRPSTEAPPVLGRSDAVAVALAQRLREGANVATNPPRCHVLRHLLVPCLRCAAAALRANRLAERRSAATKALLAKSSIENGTTSKHKINGEW